MWTIIRVLVFLCFKFMLATSVSADITTDVQQLLHRVQLVEDKGRQYEETIATMKDQIEHLEVKVAALEISNEEKQLMIDELIDKLKDGSDDNDKHEKLDGTADNIDELESEPRDNINDTDTVNHHTTTKSSAQKIDRNRQHRIKGTYSIKFNANLHPEREGLIQLQRKERQAENIAFHTASADQQLGLQRGERVILDTVLLNVGNGYLGDQGLFTAPVSGIYVFSMTFVNIAADDNFSEFDLMKNGRPLGRIIADGRHGGYDQASMTVPVQLEDGDEVWVAINSPATNANFYGYYYTSFSGFLLSLN